MVHEGLVVIVRNKQFENHFKNFSGLAEKDDAQIFDGKTDKECTKSYIVRQTTKDEIIQMYKDLVINNKKHLLIAIEGMSYIDMHVVGKSSWKDRYVGK